MLIVPLHRAPTRANFPWVTAALIAANLFVFFALQLGDGVAQARALEYYGEQGLSKWEFPAYREWLNAQPDSDRERLAAFSATHSESDVERVAALQSDTRFLADLHADKVITPDAAGYADWKPRRGEFDRLWSAMFTERWMLRFSEFDPRRMFGAMFLHGGVGHLIGNMLFLAFLGLLVEGALGPMLFLALYFVGGFGSAALSLAWRWGETGSALGASGAIAALMGAYCVLWGLRKVRFFWWFFVVFDYVKAPALILLPLWLGWELANLFFNHGAHVGFDAHAGGIVVGALIALGIKALHWERRDFLDEEIVAEAAADASVAIKRANEHIGRLELPAARRLLEPLAEETPNDLRVLVALYRCARYEPNMPRIDAAARAVLVQPVRAAVDVREQKSVFDDYAKARGGRVPLTATQQIVLAARWPAIGAGADAATLLANLIAQAPATPGLQPACLAMARALRARGENAAATTLLQRVIDAWPESPDADKARLLLADVG